MQTVEIIDEIPKVLGLKPTQSGIFIGKVLGFPVGLKIVDPYNPSLLLFQIRHVFPANAAEVQLVDYDDEVKSLLVEKKLEVEFEDKLVWITFIEGADLLKTGKLRDILTKVLSSFVRAGLLQKADICHYCQVEQVDSLTCMEERVAQICPTCLEQHANGQTRPPSSLAESSVRLGTVAPFAAAVGALGWALFWIGHDLLFIWLNTETIAVPKLVIILALFVVGGATGGPVGYVIKRIRNRRADVSVGFSIICTIAAIVLGELAYVAFWIYREFEMISFGLAWKLLPIIELEGDLLHQTIKIGAAIFSVVLAVQIAHPKKAKLNL